MRRHQLVPDTRFGGRAQHRCGRRCARARRATERAPVGSRVDAFEPAIREQLRKDPATIGDGDPERIGWPSGMTVLKERIRELRTVYLPADPSQRTTYRPGELAQRGLWFPAVAVPLLDQASPMAPCDSPGCHFDDDRCSSPAASAGSSRSLRTRSNR